MPNGFQTKPIWKPNSVSKIINNVVGKILSFLAKKEAVDQEIFRDLIWMLVDKTQLSYFYWVHSVFCWFACLLGVLFHFSPKSFTNGELLFSRIYMSRLGHCPLISLILWLTNLALESQPSLLLALPRQRWVYKLPPWWIRCHVPCRETGCAFAWGGQGNSLWEGILWAWIWRKEGMASLLCKSTHFMDEQAEVQRDQANCSRSQNHRVENVIFKSKSLWLQTQSPCHHIKNVSVRWFPEKQICWEDAQTYMQLETLGKVIGYLGLFYSNALSLILAQGNLSPTSQIQEGLFRETQVINSQKKTGKVAFP